MQGKFVCNCGYFLILSYFFSQDSLMAKQRSIFLNGIDISGAKHQILENVTVRIDGQGQIFIEAPHYEVNEESTYIPLSTWNREDGGRPPHDNTGAFPLERKKLGQGMPLPDSSLPSTPVKKIREPHLDQKEKDIDQGNPKPIPSDPRADKPGAETMPAGSAPTGSE